MLTLPRLHPGREGHIHSKNLSRHALERSLLPLLRAPYLQCPLIFGCQHLFSRKPLSLPGQPVGRSAHENHRYLLGKELRRNRHRKLCHRQRPLVRRFRHKSSAKRPSKRSVTVRQRSLMTGDQRVISAANLVLELRHHYHVGEPHRLVHETIAWRVGQVANAALTADLGKVTM